MLVLDQPIDSRDEIKLVGEGVVQADLAADIMSSCEHFLTFKEETSAVEWSLVMLKES